MDVCVVIICKEKKKKKKSKTCEKQSLCSTSHFPTCPMDQIDTLCLWQFCVLPVVQSLWQRTDAVLQLHTHIQKPCYPLHLWQWRRSYSPHAHVRSPEKCGQGFSVLFAFFFPKALQINSVSPDFIAIVIRTHARFLINDLDAWHGNVDPDPLLVLALRPSSCCHTLERKNKNTTLLKANRCIYTKAQLNSFKKQFWYFLHENQR